MLGSGHCQAPRWTPVGSLRDETPTDACGNRVRHDRHRRLHDMLKRIGDFDGRLLSDSDIFFPLGCRNGWETRPCQSSRCPWDYSGSAAFLGDSLRVLATLRRDEPVRRNRDEGTCRGRACSRKCSRDDRHLLAKQRPVSRSTPCMAKLHGRSLLGRGDPPSETRMTRQQGYVVLLGKLPIVPVATAGGELSSGASLRTRISSEGGVAWE